MNLILHLPPETEAKLQERATMTGKKPEDVALEALSEQLSGDLVSVPTLPAEAWLREFDAWVGDHRSRNPRLDDSRESIYPDRW